MNQRFGRVLIFVYGLFALSAGARAGVQLATKFHEAPLAYLLSALAAVVYLVATVCLVKGTETARRIAVGCVAFELVGVIVVGILSTSDKSAFPDATVWSGFGRGYGYVPLVLPIVGLWWLLKGSRTES
jgi:NhaP-type Na+/H+ and K+/H+ antiporter